MDPFNHWKKDGVGHRMKFTLLFSQKNVLSGDFRINSRQICRARHQSQNLKTDTNNRFLQCQTDMDNKYNEARDYMDSKSEEGRFYAKDVLEDDLHSYTHAQTEDCHYPQTPDTSLPLVALPSVSTLTLFIVLLFTFRMYANHPQS